MSKRSELLKRAAIADLNGETLPDRYNEKAFHGSTKARNHHEGLFRTLDNKRYVVDPHGAIRRTDKVSIKDE